MQNSAHRIRCLSIKADVENTDNALWLRKQLNEHWHELLPVFEQGFDAVSSHGQSLHIAKLRLTISMADSKKLASELPELLRQTLLHQLKKYANKEDLQQDQDSLSHMNLHTATEGSSNETLSDLDILWVYLKTGRLPWHVKPGAEWKVVFNELILSNFTQLLSNTVFSAESYPCFRLLALMSPSQLQKIDEIFGGLIPRSAAQYRRYYSSVIRLLTADRLSVNGTHQKLWLLTNLLKQSVMQSSDQFLSDQIFIPPAQCLSDVQAGSWIQIGAWTGEQKAYLRHTIIPALSNSVVTRDSDELHVRNVIDATEFNRTEIAKNSVNDILAEQPETISEWVYLAGIFLLHPYIPQYLKSCGIDTSGKEIQRQQREKAAALLAYLVKGKEKVAEYELELVKLMLGLPLDYSLPLAEGLISEQNKQEADRLLESFVTHWGALKNTSVEGVRESFLLRPGLLKKRQQDWLLKIERTGIDVLLDRLPFSYSLVKLPWMLKPITIEW